MIQLTQTSYVVLGLVARAGEATPYDLKQIVAATIGGFFSIPHSQLYAEPERLAGAGFPTRAPRAERPAPQALVAHRKGPQGAGGLARDANRGALRAARPGPAEAYLGGRPAGPCPGSAGVARGTARGSVAWSGCWKPQARLRSSAWSHRRASATPASTSAGSGWPLPVLDALAAAVRSRLSAYAVSKPLPQSM